MHPASEYQAHSTHHPTISGSQVPLRLRSSPGANAIRVQNVSSQHETSAKVRRLRSIQTQEQRKHEVQSNYSQVSLYAPVAEYQSSKVLENQAVESWSQYWVEPKPSLNVQSQSDYTASQVPATSACELDTTQITLADIQVQLNNTHDVLLQVRNWIMEQPASTVDVQPNFKEPRDIDGKSNHGHAPQETYCSCYGNATNRRCSLTCSNSKQEATQKESLSHNETALLYCCSACRCEITANRRQKETRVSDNLCQTVKEAQVRFESSPESHGRQRRSSDETFAVQSNNGNEKQPRTTTFDLFADDTSWCDNQTLHKVTVSGYTSCSSDSSLDLLVN